MRHFEHAAACRDLAEAVVVRLAWADGRAGWGETLPRSYVTGETIESVVGDLTDTLWPALAGGGELEELEIPNHDGDGRCINAAACAMDIACLCRLGLRVEDMPHWLMRLAGRAHPRKVIDTPVSGVLGSANPPKTARLLWAMRLGGLRNFKLKLGLGDGIDGENLRLVDKQIGKGVARGKYTLRVDVNGAWRTEDTPCRVAALAQFGVCVVEQPASCTAQELVRLAGQCELPLMADETLLTEQDARILLSESKRVWWNIRISKNGGLIRTLALARLAAENGVPFTLGCMVGESSILSAAQRLLLQLGPVPKFLEGNYGRFCLSDDLTRKSLRFGYGGRLKPLDNSRLAAVVDPGKLLKYGTLLASLHA